MDMSGTGDGRQGSCLSAARHATRSTRALDQVPAGAQAARRCSPRCTRPSTTTTATSPPADGRGGRVPRPAAIQVYEVASFYSMFETKPVRPARRSRCARTSPACCAAPTRSSPHIERKYGVKLGESTADGRFTSRRRRNAWPPARRADDDGRPRLPREPDPRRSTRYWDRPPQVEPRDPTVRQFRSP